MKKTLALLTALSFVLGTAACSNSDSDTPTSVVTVTATPEVAPQPSQDEQFADFVREGVPEIANSPTADIIGLSQTICDQFDLGTSFLEVGEVLVSEGVTPYHAGYLIGASVSYLCPEHEDLLTNNSSI